MSLAFPKPKDQPRAKREPVRRIEDPTAYGGFREVCDETTRAGRREYWTRTRQAWKRDRGICGVCGLPVRPVKGELTADHIRPRGMGAGWRDDRVRSIRPAHWTCNSERGSKR